VSTAITFDTGKQLEVVGCSRVDGTVNVLLIASRVFDSQFFDMEPAEARALAKQLIAVADEVEGDRKTRKLGAP